jgi:enterochelin esterase family protein
MPDCFTRLGGSQYVDSPATGPYRRYLIEELVPFLDAQVRTIPDRDHRGVLGKSSGGYGALCLGMTHPETFGAIACHSGDLAFDLCYVPEFPAAARTLGAAPSPEAWLERLESQVKREWRDTSVLCTLCMAACYSPDPAKPPPLALDLPFDLHTCELIPEVMARWYAHDPVRMIEDPACQAALRSLRLCYLDCGTRDEFNLQFGARILARRLRSLELEHIHEEFDDGHRSTTYRYDHSIPRLARCLTP